MEKTTRGEKPKMNPTTKEFEELVKFSKSNNLPTEEEVAPADVKGLKSQRKYLGVSFKGWKLFEMGGRTFVDKGKGHFTDIDHELGIE